MLIEYGHTGMLKEGEHVAYCHNMKRLPGDPALHEQYKHEKADESIFLSRTSILKSQKKFEEIECAGTEIL